MPQYQALWVNLLLRQGEMEVHACRSSVVGRKKSQEPPPTNEPPPAKPPAPSLSYQLPRTEITQGQVTGAIAGAALGLIADAVTGSALSGSGHHVDPSLLDGLRGVDAVGGAMGGLLIGN